MVYRLGGSPKVHVVGKCLILPLTEPVSPTSKTLCYSVTFGFPVLIHQRTILAAPTSTPFTSDRQPLNCCAVSGDRGSVDTLTRYPR
jgi:hypothetical protein